MQLEWLQISQTKEHLFTDRLEQVVVDVDRLDAVAKVVKRVSLDLSQYVVRQVNCFLEAN